MSAHTPGPWAVYQQPVLSPHMVQAELSRLVDGTRFVPVLAMVVASNGLCSAVTGCGPDSVANARLISAAPELLAELCIAMEHEFNSFEPDNQSAHYKRMAALFAKATGEPA